MDPQLNRALLVLLVGMITVFVILLLVVLTGNVLIRFVNRFFPGEEIKASPAVKSRPVFTKNTQSVGNHKLAALVAAVEVMTKGKGQIISIEKRND